MRVSRGLTSDDQRAPRTRPLRAIDHLTSPCGTTAAPSRRRVTATNSAFGDHDPSDQAPSRLLEPSRLTIHGPAFELTRSGPGAGSEVSAARVATFSSVIASRTDPTSARPGGEITATRIAAAAAAARSRP